MKNYKDINEALEKIILILKNNGELNWANSLERCRLELKNDPINACSKILSMYGGMGSFNDIVLYRDGQPLIKENNLLDAMRKKLYSICQ